MIDSVATRPRDVPLRRVLASAASLHSPAAGGMDEVRAWLADHAARNTYAVDRIDFDDLRGWHTDPATGDLRHDSGGFFRVRGLRVDGAGGPVPAWSQPIIDQPEVGVLGIVWREIDGVLCLLLQAKMEPGNVNTLQVSPTVQATRSNIRRLHGGTRTKHLEHFTASGDGRVISDVLQSEQGGRFFHKLNRNMIVEVTADVPAGPEHRWLTLGQVNALLTEDNMVNMDTRSVLAGLPMLADAPVPDGSGDPFRRAVIASLGARDGMVAVQSWLNHVRDSSTLHAELVPLAGLPQWQRTAREIHHDSGTHFEVIAASVRAGDREVPSWTQPLIRPSGRGVVAFLVSQVDGCLEVLVQAQTEAGLRGAVELGPTVQCIPANHPDRRPEYLDVVLAADAAALRYDTLLSEEGGRFYHAESRYVVVEVGPEVRDEAPPPTFRWVTLGQLGELVRHSGYLNVEARSLLTSAYALCHAGAA